MKVKTVGYYKEMPHGGNSEISIRDYINKESKDIIENICSYLDSGVAFIVSPGNVEDVIVPENGIAGDTTTYTDGEWLWPGDLSYYVRNYSLKLPDEFIATMKKNGWKVMITFDDLDCNDIEVDGEKM